jgi:hypothetical protein
MRSTVCSDPHILKVLVTEKGKTNADVYLPRLVVVQQGWNSI